MIKSGKWMELKEETLISALQQGAPIECIQKILEELISKGRRFTKAIPVAKILQRWDAVKLLEGKLDRPPPDITVRTKQFKTGEKRLTYFVQG